MTGPTYREVLARNVRAARKRLGINQQDLAARMQALGHDAWLHQTVGNVEKGKRRITAEEVVSLAYALQTSIGPLMAPNKQDGPTIMQGDLEVSAFSALLLVGGVNNRAIQWDGNTPVIGPGDPMPPLLEALTQIPEFGLLTAAQREGR